jgi:hypothetical protein
MKEENRNTNFAPRRPNTRGGTASKFGGYIAKDWGYKRN